VRWRFAPGEAASGYELSTQCFGQLLDEGPNLVPHPAINRQGQLRAAPDHGCLLNEKIGSNSARPMVPTMTPITAIMMGSIMLVAALIEVSTSRS